MSTCPSCGGWIGKDCFNPAECASITQDMQRVEQWSNSTVAQELAAKDATITRLHAEAAELRAQIARVEGERNDYKDDYERTHERLSDALEQLRCPECGCADQREAEANECGCDAPLCARNDGKTLAQSWIDAKAEAERLREVVHELVALWDLEGGHLLKSNSPSIMRARAALAPTPPAQQQDTQGEAT